MARSQSRLLQKRKNKEASSPLARMNGSELTRARMHVSLSVPIDNGGLALNPGNASRSLTLCMYVSVCIRAVGGVRSPFRCPICLRTVFTSSSPSVCRLESDKFGLRLTMARLCGHSVVTPEGDNNGRNHGRKLRSLTFSKDMVARARTFD